MFPLHASPQYDNSTTMNTLPDCLLLEILSRLDDSADVARCRVASKAFDTVFPGLRSISLQCRKKWYANSSSSRVSSSTILLDLISKMKIVESVCIRNEFCLTDVDSAKNWLPRVSESLRSLSLSGLPSHYERQSSVFPLISAYCHNLVSLTVRFTWLSMDNLNPMLMLTSLKLASTRLEDEHLNELNKCFPNLQVLKLVRVSGLKDPKIHHLKLQTCHLLVFDNFETLTLIAPSLIKLTIECLYPVAIHVEAPMLSYFNLCVNLKHVGAFTAKKFENLKTLWLDSSSAGSLLLEFPTTKTVETLTLNSGNKAPRDVRDSELTLGKVFKVFPNVSSLCINLGAWSEIEATLNPEGWEILNARKGLKTICAYLMLVDRSLTFSSVSRVLDQCIGLSQVSLLIHRDVVDTESKSLMSKCMAHWPGLKWRWGLWSDDMEDTWIADGLSSQTSQCIQ